MSNSITEIAKLITTSFEEKMESVIVHVHKKMSHFATIENVPFMPRKLVDNE